MIVLYKTMLSPRLSVAPMMDWTDRHCRSFHRLLAPHAVLYTEMVTAAAIKHGDRERLLRFSPAEHPVVLQLGGSDPALLAEAAAAGAAFGYDEINLNCGCPSDRVQAGRFGACLMAEPALVADCVAAMAEAQPRPVTVKTRIGIDDSNGYEFLSRFIETVAAAGCAHFIIHARKAWLKGLSPKENREVPPLDYEMAYRLKRDFPHLMLSVNGGIQSLTAIDAHLGQIDSVMIGREAYQNPWFLAEVEQHLFDTPHASRTEIIQAYLPYVEAQLARGVPLQAITKHMLGLFNGQRGGRLWRRYLSENTHRAGAGIAVLEAALGLIGDQDLQAVA
jgi:tRNA-dihydrouridine synthase A